MEEREEREKKEREKGRGRGRGGKEEERESSTLVHEYSRIFYSAHVGIQSDGVREPSTTLARTSQISS